VAAIASEAAEARAFAGFGLLGDSCADAARRGSRLRIGGGVGLAHQERGLPAARRSIQDQRELGRRGAGLVVRGRGGVHQADVLGELADRRAASRARGIVPCARNGCVTYATAATPKAWRSFSSSGAGRAPSPAAGCSMTASGQISGIRGSLRLVRHTVGRLQLVQNGDQPLVLSAGEVMLVRLHLLEASPRRRGREPTTRSCRCRASRQPRAPSRAR
jgi:hypothetical protein